MLRKIVLAVFILSLMKPVVSYSQEITAGELNEIVTFLASDLTKGRKPGTQGDIVSAKYIREQFRGAGLELMFEDGFQHFDVVTDVKLAGDNFIRYGETKFEVEKDFLPLSFTKNTSHSEGIIFVGYGFDIDIDSLKWNDYEGIDVKGKWVMVLRGDPEPDSFDSKFAPFADDRGKVVTANDHGAGGVIFVDGPGVNKNDELGKLYFDKSTARAEIPVMKISQNLADILLKSSEESIASLETQINNNMQPHTFFIRAGIEAELNVEHTKTQTQNVVAMLKGSDKVLMDEYIVIGAHYDHLGMGGQGSGSRFPDTIAIHNGADDNASGVATVIEIAEKFAGNKSTVKRSIIFIAFSAEEMGLLGSRYYAENPGVDISSIKAMFNFDMVGRLNKEINTIMVGGTGTSTESEEILSAHAEERDFKVNFSPEGFGASDHSSFYSKDIPVFFISTGAHQDYHTPQDDVEYLDLESQAKISDYSYDVIFDVVNRDEALTFREAGPKFRKGGRSNFKVTLGIMPDFVSTATEGLRVEGIRPDGPADKGGMLKGDIIVALDGKAVKNIYEYMSRLKQLEAGSNVTVDIIRDGKKKVLIVSL